MYEEWQIASIDVQKCHNYWQNHCQFCFSLQAGDQAHHIRIDRLNDWCLSNRLLFYLHHRDWYFDFHWCPLLLELRSISTGLGWILVGLALKELGKTVWLLRASVRGWWCFPLAVTVPLSRRIPGRQKPKYIYVANQTNCPNLFNLFDGHSHDKHIQQI